MAPVPVTSATHELVLGQHFAAHDPEVDALDDIQLLWDVGVATRISRAREESDALMAERSQELDTKPHAPPVCGLLDARIRELERDQGWIGVMNNLGLEHRADGKLADGDTLVVMNFPEPFAPWPADPPFVRCDGSQWRSVKFRVHSNKLRATGSNVFSEMFLPKQQARVLRRLKLGADDLPNGIDFVLDLTPPSEGDESASLLAMLSLPFSVRAWWQSRNRLGVMGSLVSGHDDNCPKHKTVPVSCSTGRSEWEDSPERLPYSSGYVNTDNILDPDEITPSPSRDIPDYCPIRHRASVLRLLESIECGDDELDLDSAPRVFTMAKVAKYFECTAAVRDHICSWLMDGHNSQFTEMHPESSLSISWDLELRDPTRLAFRIRVVEDAIELVDPRPVCAVQQLSKETVFGRRREPLSDELETAIEHGRVGLIERVRHTVDGLLSPFDEPLNILFGPDAPGVSSQWQVLVAIGHMLGCNVAGRTDPSSHATIYLSEVPLPVLRKARNALEELLLALGTYVRASVSYALQTPSLVSDLAAIDLVDFCDSTLCDLNRGDFTKADLDRKCYYVGHSSLVPTEFLYHKLSRYQRLLTRYPWQRLKSRLGDIQSFTTFSTGGISISTRIEHLNQCLTPMNRYLPGGYARLDTSGVLKVFDADTFALQLVRAANQVADSWIGACEVEISLARTSFLALGLSPDELAYLPLWAGGNNDETGGIFNEHAVPDADMGPIQPGPSYRTGCSVLSVVSSIAQSTPTASADSDASGETMTAGRSIRAVSATRAASSVRPLDGNRSTVASTSEPAAHGRMADDTTDQTPPGGDGSGTQSEGDFDFTVAGDDSDGDWII